MATQGAAVGGGTSELLVLCNCCRMLNDRRLDLDARIVALAPEDPGRDALWEALEQVLADLRGAAVRLTHLPAIQSTEMRAKADVVVMLLRPGDSASGPLIPDAEGRELALSLAQDTARFPG